MQVSRRIALKLKLRFAGCGAAFMNRRADRLLPSRKGWAKLIQPYTVAARVARARCLLKQARIRLQWWLSQCSRTS